MSISGAEGLMIIEQIITEEQKKLASLGQTHKTLLTNPKDQLTQLQKQLAELVHQREAQVALLAERRHAAEASAKELDSLLSDDANYKRLRQTNDELHKEYQHVLARADDATEELEGKGSAFQDDPLFMYLWQRGYATAAYKAGGFSRWGDNKLAKLIGYHDAHVNHSRLTENAQRLNEYASTLFGKSEDADQQLHQYLQTIPAATDAEKHTTALDQAQTRLSEIEIELKSTDNSIEELQESPSKRFTKPRGRDDHSAERRRHQQRARKAAGLRDHYAAKGLVERDDLNLDRAAFQHTVEEVLSGEIQSYKFWRKLDDSLKI